MTALAVWRDMSLIWLMLLTLIGLLPIGVIMFFLVKGMSKVRQVTKKYLPVAQDKARQVAGATEQVSLKIAQPVVRAHATRAQINTITKSVVRRNHP